MKRTALAFLLCLALVGCATNQPIDAGEVSSLQTKLTADLQHAIDRAKLATDLMAPQRVICYSTILSFVPSLPTLNLPAVSGDKAGVFDAFEVGAEVAEGAVTLADYQIPPEVRVQLLTACGPVAQAARDLLVRMNVRAVRVAGRVALLPIK